MSAGFYRLEPGPELVYEYTYDEMKIVVDGDFEINDETGQKVQASKGDVFFFPKGAKITFTTQKGGLAWYCGQRKSKYLAECGSVDLMRSNFALESTLLMVLTEDTA